eukprot:TRINITY_DN4623_c0_g1_i1.p2 TRINITY_DN4623_c0_g1~~TRINITY_DN4623_c0_g1_i1.p2  ORF type:complete len:107 (+),score=14.71 TRINITY_DN4623_c0_g1_i1:24-323(+)
MSSSFSQNDPFSKTTFTVASLLRPERDDPNTVHQCSHCQKPFSLFKRKYHCHNCGKIFCSECSNSKIGLPQLEYDKPVQVCKTCYNNLVQREFRLSVLT